MLCEYSIRVHCTVLWYGALVECSGRVQWYSAVVECSGRVQWQNAVVECSGIAAIIRTLPEVEWTPIYAGFSPSRPHGPSWS